MTDERPEDDLDNELDAPEFEELFAAMRAVASRPAPPMSPALTMLLAPGATGRRRRARAATVGLAVVGVLAGGVGAAAATGHLQRPAPVTRVADPDGTSDDATRTPTPGDTGTTPATAPASEADPETTDSDDRTPEAAGDDDTTAPPTRPRASDDDDSPGTGESDSDDDGEHGDEADETGDDESDGGDDTGVEEPDGEDDPESGGDEVEGGSSDDGGQSEVGDEVSGEELAG